MHTETPLAVQHAARIPIHSGMSTRVVFVWLAVALILGGIAIYLLQSGSPRSANGEAIAVGDRVVEFLPQPGRKG